MSAVCRPWFLKLSIKDLKPPVVRSHLVENTHDHRPLNELAHSLNGAFQTIADTGILVSTERHCAASKRNPNYHEHCEHSSTNDLDQTKEHWNCPPPLLPIRTIGHALRHGLRWCDHVLTFNSDRPIHGWAWTSPDHPARHGVECIFRK